MESPHGAAVAADGFGLKGPRGWAFRGVGIEAAPGSLVAIEGPSGSGRTCLLLALTGRMRPSEGRAEVGGLELPRRMAAVRRISALGPVPGVSDLDPALTVAEHLRERALLQRRFDGSLRALLRPRAERAAKARGRVDRALEMAGLDMATLPKQERTAVRDLERLEELRLSVALALIGRPRLLAVDDMDLKLSDADRAEAWALLRTVAGGGTTVLAVCSQAPQDATVVRTTPAQAGDGPGAAGAPAEKSSPMPGTTRAATADGSAEVADAAAGTPGAAAVAQAQAGDAGEPAEATHAAEAMPRGDHKDTTEEGAADALAETGRA
ncbi:ABC-2 type transport system ATP-binding protein [Streptomyces sp. V4I23]|uniref:ATP-binding cassette domain-containing protein n=1 Tax=Streptomyces sp. V4I23 TaxID=3042282 RepID=UPI002781BC29|nr:ATP-binding cassette domain-containing protein [Streptomyces sp. V4I23]MDQ1011325.1 ABC-2 type transport system ATP-binding protein [Streptomyces sp. V4I23]